VSIKPTYVLSPGSSRWRSDRPPGRVSQRRFHRERTLAPIRPYHERLIAEISSLFSKSVSDRDKHRRRWWSMSSSPVAGPSEVDHLFELPTEVVERTADRDGAGADLRRFGFRIRGGL